VLAARVRKARLGRGLTQAELATRAGVSPQLVSALEAGRHLPRVDAAAAIARVLGTTVEDLLAPAEAPAVAVADELRDGQHVRAGRVGEHLVAVPASPAPDGWTLANGVVRDGLVHLLEPERPAAVIAGCDPALGLAGRIVEHQGGPAVLVATTSTRAALAALQSGRVHVAGVHAPADALPAAPPGTRRFELARWVVGLAAPHDMPAGWVDDALAGRIEVVQRDAGAGSQQAFERAVAAAGCVVAPGSVAGGHLEAATRARWSGTAAVTIEPVAAALGMAFHPLEEHVAQVWVPADHLGLPPVARVVEELLGSRLHRRLEAIGGYDLSRAGSETAA
jgi:transcriptional regulator with XRE-family HTH domain/molybdate-binding protein